MANKNDTWHLQSSSNLTMSPSSLFPLLFIYTPPPTLYYFSCPLPSSLLTSCDSFFDLIHFSPSWSTSWLSHSVLPLPPSLPPFLFLWQAAHCSESISWRQAAVLLQWWGVQHWDCWEPQLRPAMTSWTGKITECSRRTNSSFLGNFFSVKIIVRWKCLCVYACLRPHLWF